MPELPEVQTVVNQLQRHLCGCKLKSVRILDHRLKRRLGRPAGLKDRKVRRVYRLGKRIVLELADKKGGCIYLGVHLRMTGRLVWSSSRAAPQGGDWKTNPLRARFICDRGELQFLDTRRFGTIELVDSESYLIGAGLDPLGPQFTVKRLEELLAGARGNIKSWLLRQDKICGIGNIYASEILFDAAISPLRPAGSLSKAEAVRLRRSTVKILKRAISNCGTTFSDFQDAHGVTGSYQRYLKVYLREGLNCRRCSGSVTRFVQQQRSTFYCSSCQK